LQWNRILDLKLVPHPRIRHSEISEIIEMDFDKSHKAQCTQVRAAIVSNLLQRWSVDSSPDHGLQVEHYHPLHSNPQTLYRLEQAELVPGYRSPIFSQPKSRAQA
jgi:hypothetical protein